MKRTVGFVSLIALALSTLLLGATPAQASHFRFGHITWIPRPDIGPNSVEFTVLQAWRRSSCGGTAGDGFVAVGDFGCPAPIDAGDGNFPALSGQVISIDTVADWYLSRHTAVHTYASPNNGGVPWQANFSSCCRIYAPQVNAPGTSFQLTTTVDLAINDSSPASTIFPIQPMVVNQVNNLVPPLIDNEGDTLNCRLATFLESGSGIATPPGPPNGGSTVPLIVNPNCTITWNTNGTSVGQLWALSIVIEESRGGNPPHGSAMLEFLILIVPTGTGNPPVCDSPPTPTGTVNTPAGVPYTATIQGSDPDNGDTITLNTTGVPSGATMTPGLPTSTVAPVPVSSVLNWTPTVAQVGFYPLLYSVTDDNNNQALCTFTIHVTGCGDNQVQLGEDCDGTSDAACPGLCAPPGDPNECQCPGECLNGTLDPNEECDPSSPAGAMVCDPGEVCAQNCTCVTTTTSSTTTSSTNLVTTSTSSSTTTTTIPGHFQCYEIKPSSFAAGPVSSQDQFGPTSLTLRYPHRLCAPADKNGEGIDDPVQHLTGYALRAPKFAKRLNQLVRNQFGDTMVDVVRPDLFMTPTAKGLQGPPPPLVPPTIDHFACYKVRRSHGTPKFIPRTVTVVDQFESITLNVTRPIRLCAPANKNGEDASAPSHPIHLLCYKAKSTAKFGDIVANAVNQFGPDQVRLIHRRELCVPSEKNPGAPTTTTSTQPTPTTSSSTTSIAATTSSSSTVATPTTTPTTSSSSTTLIGSPSGAFINAFESSLD
jgi:hypothetical protein